MAEDERGRPASERNARTGEREADKRTHPADSQRPESARDPGRQERLDAWIAELPPQIRRAYETRNWDDIPAKWRELLRQWTRKMAEESDKDRR